MESQEKKDQPRGQDAASGERYRVPIDAQFVELQNKVLSLLSEAANRGAPANTHMEFHVFDGNRRIGTYERKDRAIERVRAEFERRCPDVPFTLEAALHGLDAQRREYSFGILEECVDGPSRREALEKAYRDDALRQRLQEHRERPRRKLNLDEETGSDVLWVAVRMAVGRQNQRRGAPWPNVGALHLNSSAAELVGAEAQMDAIEAKMVAVKMPYIWPRDFFAKLQIALGEDQKALLSDPRTHPALRDAYLDYFVRRAGSDSDKLRLAALEWRLGLIPAPSDPEGTVRQCATCRQLYVPHDCQDKGECPRCRRAARTRKFRAENPASTTDQSPQQSQPQLDAMSKRPAPPVRHEEERPWESLPDETPSLDDFDSDALLERFAEECDRHGERTRAEDLRKIIASQGRHS